MCAFNTPLSSPTKTGICSAFTTPQTQNKRTHSLCFPPFLLFLLRPISPPPSSSPFPEISPGNGGKRGEEKKIEKRSLLVQCVCVEGLFFINVWELMTDTISIQFLHSNVLKRVGKNNQIKFCPLALFVGGPSDRLCKIRFRRGRGGGGSEETNLFFLSFPLSTSSSKPTPPPPLPNPFFSRKKGIAFPK